MSLMKKAFVGIAGLVTTLFVGEIFARQALAIDFYTIQPSYMYESWQSGDDKISLPADATDQADMIVAPVRYVLSKFPDFTYSMALKDDEVTPEAIKNIGKNQIVSWQGHGHYNSDTIVLQMGTAFNDYDTDPAYQEDIMGGGIVNAEGYYAGITAKYIEKYGKDMSGSLIYIGACESGHDGNDELARAFLDKGAATVIVMSQTIQALYGNALQYTTIKLLADINPATSNYYTVSEALAEAKAIYGANDSILYPAMYGAEALIFGDADYRIADVNTPSVPDTGTFTKNGPNARENWEVTIWVVGILTGVVASLWCLALLRKKLML